MDYTVRRATESDRAGIAKAIAVSFEKIMSAFCKDMTRIANIFEGGAVIERFFVAEQDNEIIGIAACGDCKQRVLSATKEDCARNIGKIRGAIMHRLIRSELMQPHPYPPNVGYIDVAGVLPQARGKGVAKELLRFLTENSPQYDEFILDVDSNNESAIKSYGKFGFVEYRRERVIKIFKRAKIFMRYIPNRGIK
jgi:ribosomal protein S18 acetylase RimI-like enzyme